MFLLETKTLVLEALKSVFNEDYPVADFRAIWSGMEYPADKANYPGIWVDFTPTAPLQSAGIGHVEYVTSDSGGVRKATRWRFAGNLTFTVTALSSLERDRLVDELIKVLAFGSENPATAPFRQMLEVNDLIALSVQWDTFSLPGKDESPGTPWGTPEVVYEHTVSLDCEGSFVSEASGAALVPLSGFTFDVYDDVTQMPIDPPATGDPSQIGQWQ